MGLVAVDTETVGLRGAPWSVQYSLHEGHGRMILANEEYKMRALNKVLESSSTLTVVHNALFDIPVMDAVGLHPYKFVDTMVMAYLLGENSIGLKTLAYRLCGMTLTPYAEVVGEASGRKALHYLNAVLESDWDDPLPIAERKSDGGFHVRHPQNIKTKVKKLLKRFDSDPTIDLRDKWNDMDGTEQVQDSLGEVDYGWLSDIPIEDAVHYGCEDADATFRIYPNLWQRIQDAGLEEVFWRDMGIIPMVVDMMQIGIKINPEHFYKLEGEFDEKARELLKRIETLNGGYLNPGSPLQVLAALKKRGLDIKSTDAKDLDAHRGDELVRFIQDYRGYKKLNSTYVGVLPKSADENGRVHTSFSITRTATGRLASSDPNLQNQPVRSEDGRRIREGFIAERRE